MMKKSGKLLTVILMMLLVAALAVIGWLLVERDGLLASEAALEKELLTAEQSLKDAKVLMETSEATAAALQAELSAAQATLAETQATLASTEAALAEMTAAREASDAQLATLNAELAVCSEQLQQVTAEKESADAALAALGYARVQPTVVESLPQDEVMQDMPTEAADDEADGAVAEEPASDEGAEYFSETPLEEYVQEAGAVPVTVYTADKLGVAFEAPVEWVIHADDEEHLFVMRAQEPHQGAYASLVIRSAGAEGFPDNEFLTPHVNKAKEAAEDGNVLYDLLGHTGLDAEHAALNEAGISTKFRACAVIVEGNVYCVSVMACRDCFDDVMNEIFLPLCESMRLIP